MARWLAFSILLSLPLAACGPPAPYVPPGPTGAPEGQPAEELEVEVGGQLLPSPGLLATSEVSTYRVAVFTRPCSPGTPSRLQPVGLDILDGVTARGPNPRFSLEAELENGDRAWLCAYALDEAGALLGFGQSGTAPLAVHPVGDGELGEVHGLTVRVGPLDDRAEALAER